MPNDIHFWCYNIPLKIIKILISLVKKKINVYLFFESNIEKVSNLLAILRLIIM